MTASAQKEAANWFFGDRAHISFDGCSPRTATAGSLNADEGTASISDADGNLRFYTDGLHFWNAEHELMEGGELEYHYTGPFGSSHYSYYTTTQAALIVPQPGKPDQFWTFAVGPTSGNQSNGRFCYVAVDMNANQGRGQVSVPVCMKDSLTERLAGVQHSNGRDYWVVVQDHATAQLLAYLVSDGGIASDPVVSDPGRSLGYAEDNVNAAGFMKISPDGTKLAYAYIEANSRSGYDYYSKLVIMDFDATTGQATNPIYIDKTLYIDFFYGLEFSPDNSKLYVSSRRRLWQYDLAQASVAASEKIIHRFPIISGLASARHALQLGPDGRIYMAMGKSQNIGAILYPNSPGHRASPVNYFQRITGNARSYVGLPNFVSSYLLRAESNCAMHLKVTSSCYLDSAYVTLITPFPEQVDTVQWEAPPGSSARDFVLALPFDSQQTYHISANITFVDGRDTTLRVSINEGITFQMPADTVICPGDTLWITPPRNKSYQWSDEWLSQEAIANQEGKQPNEVENDQGLIAVTEEGTYHMYQHHSDCHLHHQINVRIFDPPPLDLGEAEIIVCSEDSMPTILSSNWRSYYDTSLYGLVSYTWSTGSHEEFISVHQPGTYWVRAEGYCGAQTDTVRFIREQIFTVDLGLEEEIWICEGDELILDPGRIQPHMSIEWSTGSTDPTLRVTEAGDYHCVVYGHCNTLDDQTQVHVDPDITLILPDTVKACAGETVTLQADSRFRNYQWSTGKSDSVIQVTQPGYYELTVSNACGTQRAGTWVEHYTPEAGFIPSIITPNGDKRNDTFLLDQHLYGSHLQIYNRWGTRVYNHSAYNNRWDGEGLPAGVYWYTIYHPCLTDPLRGQVTIQRTR